MTSKRKILITGLAGFIAGHVALRLSGAGHDVVGVDNFAGPCPQPLRQARLARLPHAVRCLEMDVTNTEQMGELLAAERPDIVIHLAARAGVRRSSSDPLAFAQANVIGHLSLLEACRQCGDPPYVIYASSGSIYGLDHKPPFREDGMADEPMSVYAATKRANEEMSAVYARLHGLRQTGLRLFSVYGPFGRPDMAYWQFADAIMRGERIDLYGSGDMGRDMTYIDDVVDGIAAMVDQGPKFPDPDIPHRIYNIGAGRSVSVRRMVDLLEQAVGRSAITRSRPAPLEDVQDTWADNSRFHHDYGLAPTTPIEEGLPHFVNWLKTYSAETLSRPTDV